MSAVREGVVSSDVDVRTLEQQNFGIFEIYGVYAMTRGEGRCWASADKGARGSIFRDFGGRPLWTASYYTKLQQSR